MSWWGRLWRGRRMDDDLERELRFHLDRHAADLVAQGVAPDDARRTARLALGGPDQVKEHCRDVRGTRWLEDVWIDARYAVRMLWRQPAFAAIAVLTLALGSGATTVMFSVMNGVLLEPLSYPHADQLVAIYERTEPAGGALFVAYPTFLDYTHESRTMAHAAAWTYAGGIVSAPGEPEYVAGRLISSELFAVLDVPLVRGRSFLADEDRAGGEPVAIISERLWRRRFGADPAAIGRPLVLDGTPYTVVGIAPSTLSLDGEADVLTPLGQNTAPRMSNRQARFLRVFGRLRPDVALDDAQAELSVIGRRLADRYPASNAGFGFFVQSLQRDMTGDVSATLWLLFGAVALVLLIACVNVANLLLARAASRDREIAMRLALGASRTRLLRQCLTESAVIALVGGALSVALAAIGIRPFVALWPGTLPRAGDVKLDLRVLLFAAGASLASGILFGLAPAMRVPVQRIEQALRAGARAIAGSSRRLRSGLVVSEIALAVVLLVTASTIGRTLLRLSSLDPGVDVRNVLVARVALSPGALAAPGQTRSAWDDTLTRALRVPGTQAAALADVVPMRVGINALGYWTTPAPPLPNAMPTAVTTSATPQYLTVMGLALRRGRFFTAHDRVDSEPVVVVDEVLARHAFDTIDVVGRRLFVQAIGPTTIVGVVGHVRHWGLAADDGARIRDQIYYPLAQIPDPVVRLFASFTSLTIRTSVPPLTLLEPLQRAVREGGGQTTLYDVRTLEQLASASLDAHRFLLMLFGVFAALALLLACIGVYSVLAYLTAERVPEFGVRMALGATSRDLVRLVLGQSASLVGAGLVIGASAAWAAGHLLKRSIEGIHASDPLMFASTMSAVVLAALCASFVPAYRASRVDATTALKRE